MSGWRARISRAARRPSSVCVGGMRMSTIATSGACASTSRSSSVGGRASAATSIPASRSSAATPSRTQQAVVGDHDAHGSSARHGRPAAGRADDAQAAVERLDAVGEAAQARALDVVGAADAVVGDLDDQPPVVAPRPRTLALDACAYLATFVSASEHEVVGGELDGPGSRPGDVDGQVHVHRRRARQRVERRPEPVVLEHGRMHAAGELAQLLERRARAPRARRPCLLLRRPGRARRRSSSRSCERERDEPLLRAVVEVALEPPALGVAGLDEPGARPFSSSSRARSSTCSRAFSSAIAAAAATASSSSGSSRATGRGQRRDGRAVAVDQRRRAAVPDVRRARTGSPSTSAQLSNSGSQYASVERRVAQRARERVAQLGRLRVAAQLDHQLADRRACEAGVQQPDQEGDRREAEDQERGAPDRDHGGRDGTAPRCTARRSSRARTRTSRRAVRSGAAAGGRAPRAG